jgi:drug/metabolite transporter (DMT)-like permease
MLAAVAALAVLDVFLKLLTPHYSAMQVSTLRAAASLPFLVLPLLVRGRLARLRMQRLGQHLLRGLLAVLMMIGFSYALSASSLSNVYTLYMVAPLLVTAMAVVTLKEQVTASGWIAVAVGLLGAVCVLRPSPNGLPLMAALAALGSATCYAINYIVMRFMVERETHESMVFWFLALMAAGCAALAAPGWRPVVHGDWGWILGLGVSGAIGQSFVTRAFALAPASVVAPFDYTALLWGASFDWLIWATRAPLATILGAVLIVASGLYILLRGTPADPALAVDVPTALPADPPL